MVGLGDGSTVVRPLQAQTSSLNVGSCLGTVSWVTHYWLSPLFGRGEAREEKDCRLYREWRGVGLFPRE